MAKRKTTPRKKSRRKPRKNKFLKSSLLKAFAGVACILILVALAGVAAHYYLKPEKPLRPHVTPDKSLPAAEKPVAKIPAFEVYPKKDIPSEKKPPKTPPPKKRDLPQIAIIIDGISWADDIRLNSIILTKSSYAEFIKNNTFLLDDPIFVEPKSPGMPTVECSGRDAWKRAIETDIGWCHCQGMEGLFNQNR